MSYHIYTTKGIVLAGTPIGESSRYVYVLTKSLGLIGAHAQGVRELRSKLSFSIDLFSYAEFSFVRGKDVWRVTSVNFPQSHQALFFDGDNLRTFARMASLVRRLVVGETRQEALFDFMLETALFLTDEKLTTKELALAEALVALSVLNELGYGGHAPSLNRFTVLASLNKTLLNHFEPYYGDAVKSISRSLRESHL
jgi:DNA repair protein RecO